MGSSTFSERGRWHVWFRRNWVNCGASRVGRFTAQSRRFLNSICVIHGGGDQPGLLILARAFFPNGSVRGRPVPQVLEPDQHGQHSFDLAVEMPLVAAEPFELVGIERLAERLLAAS